MEEVSAAEKEFGSEVEKNKEEDEEDISTLDLFKYAITLHVLVGEKNWERKSIG